MVIAMKERSSRHSRKSVSFWRARPTSPSPSRPNGQSATEISLFLATQRAAGLVVRVYAALERLHSAAAVAAHREIRDTHSIEPATRAHRTSFSRISASIPCTRRQDGVKGVYHINAVDIVTIADHSRLPDEARREQCHLALQFQYLAPSMSAYAGRPEVDI
jgi:hypothetical protein